MLVKYDLDDKGNGHVFNRKKIFVELETKYQKVEISEVEVLGKILALDNIIQLSSLDSDRYHEAFAHIPASNLEKPKSFPYFFIVFADFGAGFLHKATLCKGLCGHTLW